MHYNKTYKNFTKLFYPVIYVIITFEVNITGVLQNGRNNEVCNRL